MADSEKARSMVDRTALFAPLTIAFCVNIHKLKVNKATFLFFISTNLNKIIIIKINNYFKIFEYESVYLKKDIFLKKIY